MNKRETLRLIGRLKIKEDKLYSRLVELQRDMMDLKCEYEKNIATLQLKINRLDRKR